MVQLHLKNLRKQFAHGIVPVKDISLTVNEGEFLTLLGPSGCGKSTLLRLIAGLEQPTQGQVMIGDRDVTTLPPSQRNIAMVFQSYALYPHMSVAENITAALKLRKIPPDEIEHRMMDVSHRLGLDHLLSRKPAQLSGGQRQRVALARSLVRKPDVFLLDEPLSNLDALLREQVRADLKQLFASQQKPVVYVTHDQTEAMTLSSQIAVLYDGYLQQLAPPREIYTRPANQFVAGFVGSPQMNLLTLNCEGNYGFLGDYKVVLPSLTATPQKIILGIRPEDVGLGDLEGARTFQGQVFLAEDFGKEKLISVRVPGTEQTLRAIVPPDTDLRATQVTLSLPRRQIHWFDGETGDRLN
ncbi:MAG: ABC transporter ATP-binding protein [Oscillatoriales cyanobacterium RM1_1_9]|nr:ABC transporter ATP-binding protein [Oscillatoriales cyanobacterium SM2_3_0]NJO47005.1 ABC transporter ATP-binding protein [Oscillatoriales cyanobacterium RM2_1_1]NJO72004.1 ABC transporter ATP-binding protein [Oscillatoriales cyanobacterium RM1_1_9]